MKKNLIAIAALALTGSAFAQVTITGNVIMGYKASTTTALDTNISDRVSQGITQNFVGGNNGNPVGMAGGLGIDTTVINFAATEDLGAGYSVAAQLGFDGVSRGGVAGNDTSLSLTTPVGRLSFKTFKSADYLSGSFAAVGGVGMDNKVFAPRELKDSIDFTTKLGPVFIGLAHFEQASATGGSTPGVGIGIGAGGTGAASATGMRVSSLSATYVEGKVIANVNYLSYDHREEGLNSSYKDVIRAAAAYDFGGFKVGGGVSALTTMSGAILSYSAISGSYDVNSALTLGANYASATFAGTTAQTYNGIPRAAGQLDQSRNGYGLSATYALSKRTRIIANYANWLPYGVGVAQRNEESNLLLSHSF